MIWISTRCIDGRIFTIDHHHSMTAVVAASPRPTSDSIPESSDARNGRYEGASCIDESHSGRRLHHARLDD